MTKLKNVTGAQVLLALSVCLASLLMTGCGTYRMTYIMSNREPASANALPQEMNYSHGIGLIGGGGFFFALHRMFPCFVDYTGPVDLGGKGLNGFYKIEQYHTFGQNAGAAFLSWLVLLNVYHPATVDIWVAKEG